MVTGQAEGPTLGPHQNFVARLHAACARLKARPRKALAFALGMLATTALPPAYVLPALIISIPGLVWILDGGIRGKAAFALGWWFGFGFHLTGLYWIGRAPLIAGEQYWFMVPVAAVVLPAYLAAFTGLALYLAARFWPAGPARFVILAVAWTVAEWLRGYVFTGFPWNLLGYSLGVTDSLAQIASVLGAYGLTFVVVLLAACFAVAGKPWRAQWPIPLAVLAFALIWAGGAWRLSHASDATVADVQLRIVQANVQQEGKWDPQQLADNFNRHLTMSDGDGFGPMDDKNLKLIIWPETAVPYAVSLQPSRQVLIGRLARPRGYVLTGAVRLESYDPGSRIYNSLHVIDQDGRIADSYDKFHLVPFGEFIPLRSLLEKIGMFDVLGVDKAVTGFSDFTPGQGLRSLPLDGAPAVSPLICYEAIFPGAAVNRHNRPGWLLNVTNDAWYGQTAGPYQHLAQNRMRAIEEGLPLVRAAGTGISAIFDAYGRQRGRLDLNVAGVLDGRLPAALPATLYARLGDMSALSLMFFLLLTVYCRDILRKGRN